MAFLSALWLQAVIWKLLGFTFQERVGTAGIWRDGLSVENVFLTLYIRIDIECVSFLCYFIYSRCSCSTSFHLGLGISCRRSRESISMMFEGIQNWLEFRRIL